VLRPNTLAAAVVELKAAYTFDAVLASKRDELRAVIAADVEKCLGSSFSAASDSYCILALTHPLARVPEALHGVVKYAAGINRLFNRQEDVNQVAASTKTFVCEVFAAHGARVLDVPSSVGSAFGIPVEVFWIVLDVSRAT